MLDAEALARIKERVAGATEGPWALGYVSGSCTIDHGPGNWHGKAYCRYDPSVMWSKTEILAPTVMKPTAYGEPKKGQVIGNYGHDDEPVMSEADAEFIAHARADIPKLIAALEQAERRAVAAEKALERILHRVGGFVEERHDAHDSRGGTPA